VGPYSMILPEPYEARRVLETRALQAASSGLESRVGRLAHCHPNCHAGFPGLAGLPPAPTKKEDPLFGGGDVYDTGQNTPAKPAKAATLVDWIDHFRFVDRIHIYRR
jgi:hypothetical protein